VRTQQASNVASIFSQPVATDFQHPLQQDATELVSRLASFHYTAQTRPEKKHYAHYGLDLVNGVVRDNVEAGVLEPVLAKVKIVQVRPARS
jgi:chaperonin GroEL (HSP60 family)